MNIAVNLDGVLNNTREVLMAYANYYDMTVIKGIGAICPKEYNMKTVFGWTDEQYDGFLKKYFVQIIKNTVIKPMAIAVLDKLKKEGNNIFIMTSRNNSTNETIVQVTQNWLIQHKISFDKLLIECEDKLQICKEKEIDIVIEDEPEACLQISKEIEVICFNEVYNQQVEGENIKKASDWIDIYKIIEEKRWEAT